MAKIDDDVAVWWCKNAWNNKAPTKGSIEQAKRELNQAIDAGCRIDIPEHDAPPQIKHVPSIIAKPDEHIEKTAKRTKRAGLKFLIHNDYLYQLTEDEPERHPRYEALFDKSKNHWVVFDHHNDTNVAIFTRGLGAAKGPAHEYAKNLNEGFRSTP